MKATEDIMYAVKTTKVTLLTMSSTISQTQRLGQVCGSVIMSVVGNLSLTEDIMDSGKYNKF